MHLHQKSFLPVQHFMISFPSPSISYKQLTPHHCLEGLLTQEITQSVWPLPRLEDVYPWRSPCMLFKWGLSNGHTTPAHLQVHIITNTAQPSQHSRGTCLASGTMPRIIGHPVILAETAIPILWAAQSGNRLPSHMHRRKTTASHSQQNPETPHVLEPRTPLGHFPWLTVRSYAPEVWMSLTLALEER